MGFFALALALIAQRFVVVAPDHSARAWLHALIDRLGRACDAGARREGVAAWLVLVGGCLALVVGMSWLASWAGSGATLLFHAAVVFFTIEVRALSPLSAMHVALAAGDRAQFQGLVQRWVAEPALPAGLPEPTLTEWCRRAITRALEVGHRQIFAPLFWYLILPGVTGPVLYRLAQLVAER